MKRIAIIGAGNGGRAFAAYLGYLKSTVDSDISVSLLYRTESKVSWIKSNNKIQCKGEIEGIFPIDTVTDDYSKTIPKADIILVVVPANSHLDVAFSIAPYIRNNQIILLNPGRTWGAIEFYNTLKSFRPTTSIFVGETQTLYFTCRGQGDYGVEIIKIKNSVDCCFYPESCNLFGGKELHKLFPNLNMVDDIRITSLNNIGAVLHPAGTILNLGSISRGSDLKFYTEGMTRAVCQIIEKIDKERCEIIAGLGLKPQPLLEWIKSSYGINAEFLSDAFKQIPYYQTITAPKTPNVRYLFEDVPTGLVPLASLADYLGIECPAIKSIISLAGITLGVDFMKSGRTIENIELPDALTESDSDMMFSFKPSSYT